MKLFLFFGRGERNRKDDFDNDLCCLSIILFIISGLLIPLILYIDSRVIFQIVERII